MIKTLLSALIFIGLTSSTYSQVFTEIETSIPGSLNGSVNWGDFDNDGDLDFFIGGTDFINLEYFSGIYENDSGKFILLENQLKNIVSSSPVAEWGDFDNDDDLDIVINSKIFKNDNGSFTDINAGLTQLRLGSTSWGDYDNDGDLDLLETGISEENNYLSLIYENQNGNFVQLDSIELQGVWTGSGEWGDFDGDKDLDILITGELNNSGRPPITKVYKNNLNTFSEYVSLTGIGSGSGKWGDYDADGDLDILLSGNLSSIQGYTKLFKNEDNTFSESEIQLPQLRESNLDWIDYNNDGTLDIILTGRDSASNPNTQLFKNTGNHTFVADSFGIMDVDQSSFDWGDYDNDGDLDLIILGVISDGSFQTKIYQQDSVEKYVCQTPQTPTICQVTVDEETGKNMLIWDYSSDFIGKFGVYRESNIADQYLLIEYIEAGSFNTYIDTQSSPSQQSNRYKILAVDSCGESSELSKLHKTIHLTINQGLENSINLIWDQYQGFAFGTYKIYRSVNNGNFELIKEIASNLTSYTDKNIPEGKLSYQIEVVNPNGCGEIANGRILQYNSSKSNIAKTNQIDVKCPDLETPNICQVTINQDSSKNMLIWSSDISKVKKFGIYKAINGTEQYSLIEYIEGDNFNSYIDNNSFPSQKSEKYKISAIDSCGNESSLSQGHKTIYLSAENGSGKLVNLIWEPYEGFDFTNYRILRSLNGNKFELLLEVKKHLNFYSDSLSTNIINAAYQIEVVNPNDCGNIANGRIQQYNSSKSNITEISGITGIKNSYLEKSIIISPNPTPNIINIKVNDALKGNYMLTDLNGKEIQKSTFENGIEIDLNNQKRGVYFLNLITDKGSITKKIVRE